MHMRRSAPQENPTAVCFSFKTRDYRTHEEVKEILERNVGIRITSLQYDPLYVHSANSCSDTRSRWIVTYRRRYDAGQACKQGFEMNGNKIMIRKLDDVINCELEAYHLYRADMRRKALYNALLRVDERRKALNEALKKQKNAKFA
ncbi:hypothetical protein FSP39_025071 [Pinctada imbricata]|uniref:Uncharacterized protein n=1 Tax=Pinctada imbricata TaxID=66713 RepID=A0AA88XUP8_PINIB|nr:hypothetical protein FSP39_025071 [Pinctada imbricata]